MSYIQSLRFKLMLLCIIPLMSAAFLFIAHSVVIAYQERELVKTSIIEVVTKAGAEQSVIDEIKNYSQDMSWIARQWTIVFLVLFVCFYIPITINIKRFITPIRQMAKHAEKLAEGDVSIEVIQDRTDEIGVLQQSFINLVQTSRSQAELIAKIAEGDLSGSYTPRSEKDVVGFSLVQMLERNNEALGGVLSSAHQLSAASANISDGAQSIAQGSTQQAAAVEQLSSSISEISDITQTNADMAGRAASLAASIMQNAEKGSDQMNQMMNAVRDINQASQNIGKVIKVIKVIDDIAFQTNILALNAAVEAARAGQHGKGFAVVAEEVRNLAAKSAVAAKDTGSLITNSIEKAELGARIAEETSASLTEIVQGISESNMIISDIANSSGNQSAAISQINKGIDQVAQVVHQNSANAEESAAASAEMSEQSDMLYEMVGRFKLKNNLLADNTDSIAKW